MLEVTRQKRSLNVCLVHAERRSALASLEYALPGGADSAYKAKTEVDATIKQTSEQVSPLPYMSLVCAVQMQQCCLFFPRPMPNAFAVPMLAWYSHSLCEVALKQKCADSNSQDLPETCA